VAGVPNPFEQKAEKKEPNPDIKAGSNHERWSNEWQQYLRNRQASDLEPGNVQQNDAAERHVPDVELTRDSEKVRDLTLRNERRGTSDTVAAVNPRPGETMAELFKRLHPNLSDEQLAKEVQKVLKYNRDYGNDLGDGGALDPNRPVYLTSVKYLDEHGRINRIEGPTGRVTEVAYDANNAMSGYKITNPDGKVFEQAARQADGSWLASREGQTAKLASAEIDLFGNITAVDAHGNKVGHLTRGDDVVTRIIDGQLTKSTTYRNEQKGVVYEYEAVNGGYNLFARYPDDPNRRVSISMANDQEDVKRVALALGAGPHAYKQMSDQSEAEPADITGDQYVASKIVKAGYQEASERNTVGWCYSGVADALDKIGVHLHGRHAYMAKDQLLQDHRFQVVSINDLKPGDVLVHGKSANHDSGHIAIYLGNGQEASDHVQSLIKGQGYGGTTVFRYVGNA
jgi:hypothetical protein